MPGKNNQGGQWKQISVLLRADIVLKAGEMNLDISDACNRTLADLTGIDFPQGRPTLPVTPPKITPGAETSATKLRTRVLHPVINADDPTAVVKLMKTKGPHEDKPVPETPLPVDNSREIADVPSPVIKTGSAAAGKGKAVEREKKRKDDMLKKFVTEKIIRVDSGAAAISKDEMFQAFTRWCRDHRCSAVPEKSALS